MLTTPATYAKRHNLSVETLPDTDEAAMGGEAEADGPADGEVPAERPPPATLGEHVELAGRRTQTMQPAQITLKSIAPN